MTLSVPPKLQPFENFRHHEFISMVWRPENGFELVDKDQFEVDRSWQPRFFEPGLALLGDGRKTEERRALMNGPWLVPTGNHRIHVNPLEEKSLHRKFADLISDEDIRSFASKWGGLKQPVKLIGISDPTRQTMGEILGEWRNEISAMIVLSLLYDLAQAGDEASLREAVTWESDCVAIRHATYRSDGEIQLLLDRKLHETLQEGLIPDLVRKGLVEAGGHLVALYGRDNHVLDNWTPDDVIQPTIYFVHQQVNRRLKYSQSSQLLPLHGGDRLIEVESTRAAIWLQFSRELTGETRQMRCKACGEWMADRTQRGEYCDSRCRKAGYRRRKRSTGA